MILEGQIWPEVYLQILKQVREKGMIVGKGVEVSPLYFEVDNPRILLVPLKKNWKWALHEGINRLSFEEHTLLNPGTAYQYRSSWKRKLEKEGGNKFDYSYGDVYKEQIPLILKRLRIGYRECIINVWNEDHLINRDDFERRPCTLTLQFLINNGSLDLMVNMRTNDVINLLPYDFFHHALLQRYIATELEVPIGKYCHFAGHAYFHKKRMSTSSLGNAIVALEEALGGSQHQLFIVSVDDFTEFDRIFLMKFIKNNCKLIKEDLKETIKLSEFGMGYFQALLYLHKKENQAFDFQLNDNLNEFEAIKL